MNEYFLNTGLDPQRTNQSRGKLMGLLLLKYADAYGSVCDKIIMLDVLFRHTLFAGQIFEA